MQPVQRHFGRPLDIGFHAPFHAVDLAAQILGTCTSGGCSPVPDKCLDQALVALQCGIHFEDFHEPAGTCRIKRRRCLDRHT